MDNNYWFDLQLFAGNDDFIDPDDLDSLFEADEDADDDLDTDLDGEDDKLIPKSRVTKLFTKEIGKIKSQVGAQEAAFKEAFGVSPEEAIMLARQNAQQTERVEEIPDDPLERKFYQYDREIAEIKGQKALELEAAEFVQTFPGVQLAELPEQVIRRRERGGCTLAEAYAMFLGTQVDARETAARKAGATDAVRQQQRNRAYRTEGADVSIQGDSSIALTPDDADFMKRVFDMTPKDTIKYTKRLKDAQKYI